MRNIMTEDEILRMESKINTLIYENGLLRGKVGRATEDACRWMNTALDALERDNPSLHVANERIRQSLSSIHGLREDMGLPHHVYS